MAEDAVLSEPRETEGEAPEPRTDIEKVALDDVADSLKEAKEKCDDREEVSIDWSDLGESVVAEKTADDFRDHVGEHFELDLGQATVKFELQEILEKGEAPDLDGDGCPDARAPFSLIFQGRSPRAALPGGWYQLSHPAFPDLSLHLQPLAAEDEDAALQQPRFEAIFN